MSETRDTDDSDLQTHTVTGVLWAGGARVGQQMLQFGVTIVLARLLGPSDFGLFAMIAVFAGFASLLVDFGLSAALVQRKAVEERHLSTAFWMNLAAGAALTALMAAAAPAIAAFYGEPRLLTLTLVLSCNFLLASPVIVQAAILYRSMNFRRLAAIETFAAVVAGGLAIAAAVYGLGVWSLAVQVLGREPTVRLVALWLVTSWRPSFRVDRQAARELWGYSSHLAGFSTLNYWTRNLDNLLVGRFVGPYGLGIYSRAYSTMMLPLTPGLAVVSRVMFPALARIQDDHGRVKRAYLRVGRDDRSRHVPDVGRTHRRGETLRADALRLCVDGVVPILQILCLAALDPVDRHDRGLDLPVAGSNRLAVPLGPRQRGRDAGCLRHRHPLGRRRYCHRVRDPHLRADLLQLLDPGQTHRHDVRRCRRSRMEGAGRVARDGRCVWLCGVPSRRTRTSSDGSPGPDGDRVVSYVALLSCSR